MIESKLSKKVLLLNSSYEPLSIINCKKAIIMLLVDKVEYIEKLSLSISSEKIIMPIPSVVKLKSYIFLKRRQLALSRKNIFKRDLFKCQYCGRDNTELTLDHVIPKQKGGTDTWDNLVSACSNCNFEKGNKLIKETNMTLIKKPKQPNYLMYLQNHVGSEYKSWKQYLYMN